MARKAAVAHDPDRGKVQIHWICERCRRLVHAKLDKAMYDRYASGRLPYYCGPCEAIVDYRGGLFGDWLEEQKQCGR